MPVARFDRDEQFWLDWERQWFLYGTVYAINLPEPRVVPYAEIEVRERGKDWPDSLDAAWAEAVAGGRFMGLTKTETWTEAAGLRVSEPSVEWTATGIDKSGLAHVGIAAVPAAALRLLAANLRETGGR